MANEDYKWLEHLVTLKIAERLSSEGDLEELKPEIATPGAYLLMHPVTHQIYAGSTGHLYNRRYNHRWRIANGTHRNSKVRNAFLDVTPDQAIFFYWVTATREEAYALEQRFLTAYADHPKSLNIATDAIVAGRGIKRSVETREKTRQAALAMWSRPEYRALKSQLMKEYAEDPKNRKRLAEQARVAMTDSRVIETLRAKANEQWSDPEARRKKSEEVKAKHQDPEYRARYLATRAALMKPVSAGGIIFPSTGHAAAHFGVHKLTVIYRIKNSKHPDWFFVKEKKNE